MLARTRQEQIADTFEVRIDAEDFGEIVPDASTEQRQANVQGASELSSDTAAGACRIGRTRQPPFQESDLQPPLRKRRCAGEADTASADHDNVHAHPQRPALTVLRSARCAEGAPL